MHSDAASTSVFSPLIEMAIELSAQWHDGTYRKSRWRDPAFEVPTAEALGVPVMAHVTNVALTVQRAGWDDVTVAAAFLHDVIEDANRYGEELRYGELCALMGEEVARRVAEVTERKYDEHGNPRSWRVRKEDYVAALRAASSGAMAISLADKLHNLWSMNESLASGINVFEKGPNRKPLSAGPEAQRWFFRAVLEASTHHADPRLEPLRAALREEIERFERLAATLPGPH
ncbi:HD domain-containing protein [Rhodocaloribacter litoris]|uniref:HD domain-containing protein n=1 Tax=Rhodocaloribacter litoris TaxID=2558931 RepID=UPI00141FC658|nr:HD domain-containing protein [Rhodocaloribacter litoris]QXD14442.1 HD domain-containing protein [Rhodocaloribacter litoris]